MRVAIKLTFALILSSLACSVLTVYIRVAGTRTACDVQFKRPFYASGDPVVEEVEVFQGARDESSLHCRLRSVKRDGRSLSRWVYGTAPAGFALDMCGPLSVEQRYFINVGYTGGVGGREFVIRADGTVDDLGREWW
jgi:hypothetical protein